MKKNEYWSGFNLLEILFALLIVSSLLLGAFQYSDFYQQKRLNLLYEELKKMIFFARALAIQKGVDITMTPLPASHGDWSLGLILFVDNPKHLLTENEPVLYEKRWQLKGARIFWQGFRSKNYLIFSPFLPQASANGTFTLSTRQGKERKIVLNRLGSLTR